MGGRWKTLGSQQVGAGNVEVGGSGLPWGEGEGTSKLLLYGILCRWICRKGTETPDGRRLRKDKNRDINSVASHQAAKRIRVINLTIKLRVSVVRRKCRFVDVRC